MPAAGGWATGIGRALLLSCDCTPEQAGLQLYARTVARVSLLPPNAKDIRGHKHPLACLPRMQFLEQFLVSPVRTEDPSEANLFFIPAFTFSYSGGRRVGSAEGLHWAAGFGGCQKLVATLHAAHSIAATQGVHLA